MKKLDCKDTTVLFPGGFKPLTGAHIDLINRYLKHPSVKRVVLFMSPSKRDVVNVDDAYEIAKTVLSGLNVEVVLDKSSYSPILAIYRWIENTEREPGKYVLASSTKDEDYKRVREFTNNYKPDKFGKNLPKGVMVNELLINLDPLRYKNGEPISSTRTREYLFIGDYSKFKESYPNLSEDTINYIWKTLNKTQWAEQQVTSNKFGKQLI